MPRIRLFLDSRGKFFAIFVDDQFSKMREQRKSTGIVKRLL